MQVGMVGSGVSSYSVSFIASTTGDFNDQDLTRLGAVDSTESHHQLVRHTGTVHWATLGSSPQSTVSRCILICNSARPALEAFIRSATRVNACGGTRESTKRNCQCSPVPSPSHSASTRATTRWHARSAAQTATSLLPLANGARSSTTVRCAPPGVAVAILHNCKGAAVRCNLDCPSYSQRWLRHQKRDWLVALAKDSKLPACVSSSPRLLS